MRKTLNEVEEIAKKIKSLSHNFDGEDRMQWALDNGVSFPTITRYMAGDITNKIVAEKLLKDIKSKIAKREFSNHMKKK